MSKRLAVPIVTLACLVAPAAAMAASTDRDRDGLPDRWERSHGLSTARPSAEADPDRDRLANIRELCVAIVMDSFGVGTVSLGLLTRYSFDKIKLDRHANSGPVPTAWLITMLRCSCSTAPGPTPPTFPRSRGSWSAWGNSGTRWCRRSAI